MITVLYCSIAVNVALIALWLWERSKRTYAEDSLYVERTKKCRR